MSKIIEAADLPQAEKVFLRKGALGWRVVEPWTNPDGSRNWFNIIIGGKKNLFMLAILFAFLGLVYLGVQELIGNYELIAENPCAFCTECREQFTQTASGQNPNLPDMNISLPALQ